MLLAAANGHVTGMIIRVPLRGLSARLRVSIGSNGIAPLWLNFDPIRSYEQVHLRHVLLHDIARHRRVRRHRAAQPRRAHLLHGALQRHGPSRAVPLRSTCRSRPPRAVFVPFWFRAVPRPAAAARGMLRARMHTGGVQDTRARLRLRLRAPLLVCPDSARLGSTRLGHTQIMMAFGGACYGFVIGTVTSLVTQVSRHGMVSRTGMVSRHGMVSRPAWYPTRHGIPPGMVSHPAWYPTWRGIPPGMVSHSDSAWYPARHGIPQAVLHGVRFGQVDANQRAYYTKMEEVLAYMTEKNFPRKLSIRVQRCSQARARTRARNQDRARAPTRPPRHPRARGIRARAQSHGCNSARASGYKRAAGRGERDLRAAVRAATKLSCLRSNVLAGITSCCCRTRPRSTRSGPVRIGAILCPRGQPAAHACRAARSPPYSARPPARPPARREYSRALFRPPARGAARRPSQPRALVRLGVLYAGVVYAWRVGCAAHAVCACVHVMRAVCVLVRAVCTCCMCVCAACVCVMRVCVQHAILSSLSTQLRHEVVVFLANERVFGLPQVRSRLGGIAP